MGAEVYRLELELSTFQADVFGFASLRRIFLFEGLETRARNEVEKFMLMIIIIVRQVA